jgi:hypothetical protein
MQQFLEAQTQLLQNLTNTVTNLQGQVNNPPAPQPAPRNKHWELMSHHPPCSLMPLIRLKLRIG